MTKFIIAFCLTLAVVSAQSSFRGTERLSIDTDDLLTSDLEAFNFGQCLTSTMGLIFPITKLVDDVKSNRKDFDTMKADVIAILSNTNAICDGCSIPRPSTKQGPVNMEKCILDFEIFADIGNNIVKNKGNIFAMIPDFAKLIAQGPTILMDCGIKL